MASSEGRGRRWLALGIVLSASFMQLIDVSIVNVAIPSIQRQLRASYGEIQLVLAGYQLAFAVLLITGGRLGDIFGRRRIFLIGMSGFVAASAACGLAQSSWMLIASRILQGLFSALMYPQVFAIMQVTFPAKDRARAFGIFGASIGIATIAGPLVGGLLIKADLFKLDWRPIFLVNLVVGLPAVVLGLLFLPESAAEGETHVDLPGVLLSVIALFALVFPLVEGREAGWPAWAFLSLGAAAILLSAFAWLERRKTHDRRFPLVDFRLFNDRAFVVGMPIMMLFFMGIPSFFLVFTLLLQIGLRFTPLHAGLTTIPFAIASAIGSTASIRLVPRLGKTTLTLGTGLVTLGIGAVMATLAWKGVALSGRALIPSLLIAGFGTGVTVAPLINIVLASVKPELAGSASGVLTTFQQVGGAIGVALVGVLLFGLLGARAPAIANEEMLTLRQRLGQMGAPRFMVEGIARSFETCFVDRSRARDPSAEPESCRRSRPDRQGSGPFGRQLPEWMAAAAQHGVARNFVEGAFQTFWMHIAIFGCVFLLIFLLPNPRKEALGEPVPGAS